MSPQGHRVQLFAVVSLHLDEHPSKFVKGLGLIVVVGPEAVRLDGLPSRRDVFACRSSPLFDARAQILVFEREDELEDPTMRTVFDVLLIYRIAQNFGYCDSLSRLDLVFIVSVVRWQVAEHDRKLKKLASVRRDVDLSDAVGHQDAQSLSEGLFGWTRIWIGRRRHSRHLTPRYRHVP